MVVGLATMALGAGLSALSARSAKKEAEKQRQFQLAQIKEQQDQALRAENMAVSRAERAAAPLDREAELLRTASRFRDPIIEQGLTQALRQRGEAETRRTEAAGGAPNIGRSRALTALLQGRGLLAAESRRIKRFQEFSRTSAALRQQAAKTRTSAIGPATQARISAASNIAAIGPPPETPNVGVAALGGALSALGTMEDGQLMGELSGLFGGGGGGGGGSLDIPGVDELGSLFGGGGSSLDIPGAV